MGTGLTDRRLRAEQRLFDCHARLERARGELVIATERVECAAISAEDARARMSAAETAVAQQEWCAARRRLEQRRANAATAAAVVASLEATHDALLSDLLG